MRRPPRAPTAWARAVTSSFETCTRRHCWPGWMRVIVRSSFWFCVISEVCHAEPVSSRALALPAGPPKTPRGRHRGLARAAALAAAPAALILVAGAGAAVGRARRAARPAPPRSPRTPAAAQPQPARRPRGVRPANGPASQLAVGAGAEHQLGAVRPGERGLLAVRAIRRRTRSTVTPAPTGARTRGKAPSPSTWARQRFLDGLGITLDAASPSADATIQLASSPGQWTTLPSATNLALDPGNPMYMPLPWDTHGAVCPDQRQERDGRAGVHR